ncbi:serine O-acetyltransferase [Pseudomonas sp. PDM33]|uniref:serine O-acetyltransferase n=1 Tax=Pseudomonas sp. PDM33 TaxID=2854765 RepID=UPI001C4368BD|nr:serine O-acetyltransferase [Pseudomonas sp. PDM33]MBV7582443.1 serine O-acetyltransferase [Pseudomonas sp. PDM33]
MNTDSGNSMLQERLLELLNQVLKPTDLIQMTPYLDDIWSTVLLQVQDDLHAYADRDPASRGRPELILETYASFRAVLFHRFAHQVWLSDSIGENESIAHRLANAGKLQSGIEIHPAACIGSRFVLDHGFGTVIGETCEIGDDCYVLSGVTLGASGIADNRSGKRHPTLGNGVEVGAGARILGAIRVGNYSFISPACVITRDVRAHSRVSVVNQLQLQRDCTASYHGYVGAFVVDSHVHLVGELPNSLSLSAVDADHCLLDWLGFQQVSAGQYHYQYRVCPFRPTEAEWRSPISLRLSGPDHDITLLDPPGLARLVESVVPPQSL